MAHKQDCIKGSLKGGRKSLEGNPEQAWVCRSEIWGPWSRPSRPGVLSSDFRDARFIRIIIRILQPKSLWNCFRFFSEYTQNSTMVWNRNKGPQTWLVFPNCETTFCSPLKYSDLLFLNNFNFILNSQKNNTTQHYPVFLQSYSVFYKFILLIPESRLRSQVWFSVLL